MAKQKYEIVRGKTIIKYVYADTDEEARELLEEYKDNMKTVFSGVKYTKETIDSTIIRKAKK